MGRLGGVVVACSLCMWPLLAISQVSTARSSTLPTARVAAIVARIIRQDARQSRRRSRASVTVVRRCCGVRVLRVRYRTKPRGYIKRGAYVLRLEASRDVVRGVGIFVSATEVRKTSGIRSGKSAWRYGFVIHHESHGSNGGWSFGEFSEGVSSSVGGRGRPSVGLGFSRECRLYAPIPTAFYQQVSGILARAKRHEAARSQGLPTSVCHRP